MTLVEFIKVISETDKTAKCVMLSSKEEADGYLTGQAYPLPDKATSEPFTLRKRGENLRGSYPFCNNSKRLDTFMPYDYAKNVGIYFNHCD